MKVGLEVHQQLATGKLFCECPTELSEEVRGAFARRLRSASGENHAVDAAAALQAARGLTYRYEIAEASCLVEMDEEPPHPLNPAALDVALTLALLLEAQPVDEIEVMRKIVVDGSNTAGFQRTALIAVDGHLDLHGKRYSILSVCLEEDAARRVGESSGEVTFRLDRLGIPLVEIATGPEITNGAEAREVAQELGALLRATRQTRRGIGTIREDVNVSTDGGRRIEVKGVQELGMIHEYVDREVGRQEVLLRVRDELLGRRASPPPTDIVDVTPVLSSLPSGPLSETSRKGGVILAARLPGFGGLLRASAGSEERLGRELADQARSAGLRGLLHSDELPGYGLATGDAERVRTILGLGPDDAFVLVSDPNRGRAVEALRRVVSRAAAALDGVPGETRDPLPDGRTRYSRPLAGRDRMYPETDIPPIPVFPDHLARLSARLPERPSVLRERLARESGLAPEVVRQLVSAGHTDAFEELVRRGHAPSRVARLLIQDLPAVPRAAAGGEVDLPMATLDEVLRAQESGGFAKEGVPNVLFQLAQGAPDVASAVRTAGLSGFTEADLELLVERVVGTNEELVRDRGNEAFSPLMGDVMKEVRGRRDGQEVAAALRKAISRRQPGTGG
ncbi:MAG: Glu-tRNA(Gln) amidotransferase subunit GatE [Thermoplasmata archaeon]